jgi:hypothetical protein
VLPGSNIADIGEHSGLRDGIQRLTHGSLALGSLGTARIVAPAIHTFSLWTTLLPLRDARLTLHSQSVRRARSGALRNARLTRPDGRRAPFERPDSL